MSDRVGRLRFARDHRWTPRHLSAYLDGELATRAHARVHRHLAGCWECRGVLRGLERMLSVLRRLPASAEEESPNIAAAVRRGLVTRRGDRADGD